MEPTWTTLLQRTLLVWLASRLVFSSAQLYLQPMFSTQGYFTKDEFVVTCFTPADSGATKLSWHSPSGEIKDTKGRIHIEPESAESHESLRLVVLGVRKSDEGDYKCIADHDGGEITESFKLVVYRSITFAGTNAEHIATEGEDSTNILCNAKAEPEPTVTWIFNRSSLKSDMKYTVSKTKLTIHNVSRQDDGVYGCQAVVVAQKNSKIKRMNIRLRVEYPPEWVTDPDPQPVYAAMGSVRPLTCQAEAYPVPNYQWLKNGEIVSVDAEEFNITNTNNKSILNVHLENSSYFGDYLCRVSNTVGTLEQTMSLKRGDPPASPKVLVQNSDHGILYLKIFETGQNPLDTRNYVVQYKSNVDEEWETAKVMKFETEKQIAIPNLSPDTEYLFRAAAVNSVGLGQYSEEIHHHTKPIEPATVRDQESSHEGPKNSAPNDFHQSYDKVLYCLTLFAFNWMLVSS